MKGTLLGIAALAAVTAGAAETELVSVDVTSINSSLSNTIITVSSTDLGGGSMTVSNLVKTAGLTEGDKIWAYDGSNFECWTLASGGIWEKAEKKYTCNISGVLEASGTDASIAELDVGQGVWIERQSTSGNIVLFGQTPTTSNITVTASVQLVGNSTTANKTPTISGMANGDQIIVPDASAKAKQVVYTYNGSVWRKPSGFGYTEGLPTITAGTGFWYKKTGGNVTISWE